MSTQPAPRFTPNPTGLAAEFYAHCARGELRFQRCSGCAAWRHPPRVLCPHCGSESWEWARSSGRGKVFSWTTTHQPLHPAFAQDVPYAVCVVELEEGPRLVSMVRDVAPAELLLDMPVEVGFDVVSEAIGLHFFRQCRR
jgi:uncharacterized OB-fold protein